MNTAASLVLGLVVVSYLYWKLTYYPNSYAATAILTNGDTHHWTYAQLTGALREIAKQTRGFRLLTSCFKLPFTWKKRFARRKPEIIVHYLHGECWRRTALLRFLREGPEIGHDGWFMCLHFEEEVTVIGYDGSIFSLDEKEMRIVKLGRFTLTDTITSIHSAHNTVVGKNGMYGFFEWFYMQDPEIRQSLRRLRGRLHEMLHEKGMPCLPFHEYSGKLELENRLVIPDLQQSS